MSNTNNNGTAARGVGFSGLLTIVFIVLKLCNVIKWSWLWVLSPLWISVLIFVLFLVFFALLAISISD